MVSTIIGIMIGIAIGACLGNYNIRHKIFAQLNKATTEKPHKDIKDGVKSVNNKCKLCDGTGVQVLNTGLKVECPACKGTGVK